MTAQRTIIRTSAALLLLASIAGAETPLWKDLRPADPAGSIDQVIKTTKPLMHPCAAAASGSFFCPGEVVAREEAAQSLERLLVRRVPAQAFNESQQPGQSYTDVPASYALAPWIVQSVQDGLLSLESGRFVPYRSIARRDLARALALLLVFPSGQTALPTSGSGYSCVSGGSSRFGDVPAAATLDCRAINYLGVKGVVAANQGGCTTGFCPDRGVPRSLMAQWLTVAGKPAGATLYYPLTPCRAFDTRDSGGPTGGAALAPWSRVVVTIAGACGVTTEAKALSANVTVVGGTTAGELRVIAGTLTSSNTSVIPIPTGRARANNALIQLATDGSGTLSVINGSAGTVHAILDVNGYFQ
jgi:hypothetical protein